MALKGIDDRPSSGGGSEGTTESVLRQLGHKKQLRAHLVLYKIDPLIIMHWAHLFFSARTLALGTSNKQLGQ